MPLDSDEDEISDEEIVQGVISTDENQTNLMKQQNNAQPQPQQPGQAHFRQGGDVTDSDEEAYSSGDYDADIGTVAGATSKAARQVVD